jgi:hypothetical protein
MIVFSICESVRIEYRRAFNTKLDIYGKFHFTTRKHSIYDDKKIGPKLS